MLSEAALDSYNRMRKAGCPAGVTSATRSTAEQERIFLQRYRPQATGSGKYGDVKTYKGKRYVRHSAAGDVAVPGTSRHETGLALDLPEPARSWVRKHGAAYGWIGGLVRGEPWHFEYQAKRDTKRPKPKPKPSSKPSSKPALSRGDTGDRVRMLQRGLNETFPAYSKLATDSSFGPSTERVVREFQRRAGLVVDGIVGPATQAALAKHGVRL